MGRSVHDLRAGACDHERPLPNVLEVRSATVLVLPRFAHTNIATRLAGAQTETGCGVREGTQDPSGQDWNLAHSRGRRQVGCVIKPVADRIIKQPSNLPGVRSLYLRWGDSGAFGITRYVGAFSHTAFVGRG